MSGRREAGGASPPPQGAAPRHPQKLTDVKGVDARTRHRLVGNGRRWGVAARLLCMLVAHTFAAPTAAEPTIPATPRCSTIDFVAGILKPGLSMDCRPPQAPAAVPEHGVMFWQLAADMVHPTTARPILEPASSCSSSGASSATTSTGSGGGAAGATLTSLRRLDYPDMDGVTDDLTNSFDMVGTAGPGWRKRTDGRYNNREHIQDVCQRNRQYVQSRLQRPTPSKYAEQLLDELVEEQRLGRVVGPLRAPADWAPADWPCQTLALPHISGCDVLLDAPPKQLAAASFPIVQEDEQGQVKLRRGEDWRRSGHNAIHGVKVVHVVAAEEEDQGPHHPARLKFQTDAAAPNHMTMCIQSVIPAAVGRNVAQCSGRRTGHCRYALSMSWPKAARSVFSSAMRRDRSAKSPTV